MYLRSHVKADKGRHEHTREAVEADCGARGRGQLGTAGRIKGRTKAIIPLDCWDLEVDTRLDRLGSPGRDSEQACLRRGMSEGERAVITPRIGWRKLTDPGD
ncbi:hypothetical protein WN55_04715 [Dufourea novaeangliae]|uniref:Uncharacterized protein n=1 Tax=Dufourea novaeangliae TaxID=178035 RepID=A0A154P1G9_DUFNO|nr:hypothetical protein WN55_04715 [Dufourea novaeangliae]